MYNKQEFQNKLEESLYDLFLSGDGTSKKNKELKSSKNIKNIDMVPTNANQCNVMFDGKSVYSNCKFYPGDIIEICPCRDVSKSSLYSRDIRDMVFEVEPDVDFVIPMGYCQFYDIISRKNKHANCDYEWDPNKRTIIIRAINKIDKYEKLVLNIEK